MEVHIAVVACLTELRAENHVVDYDHDRVNSESYSIA